MKKRLLLEKISKEEMTQHIKDYYQYAKNFLDIDKKPKVIFNYSDTNADDFLGKTGFYDPEKMEIHLYVTDRHPKDIVRSFAHELIHHYQNLNERLPKDVMNHTKDVDYASKDKHLRDMEREAFEKGNMMFRDWTDSLKVKRGKTMNEKRTMTKKDIAQRHDVMKGLEKKKSYFKKKYKGRAKEVMGRVATDQAFNMPESEERFPDEMSLDQAKEKGIPPEADITDDNKIQGWEAGRSAAISSKTKTRKMEEAKELQAADPRLEKVLTKEERVLDAHKTQREEIIYKELMRRFLNQGK